MEIAQQIKHEGVREVHLVSSNPRKWKSSGDIKVWHRDKLMKVQDRVRDMEGVSALIYEQTCAAELRRQRKRGILSRPDSRIYINPRVCEGCGDCQVHCSLAHSLTHFTYSLPSLTQHTPNTTHTGQE